MKQISSTVYKLSHHSFKVSASIKFIDKYILTALCLLCIIQGKAQNLENLKSLKPFSINGSLSLRQIFNQSNGQYNLGPSSAFVAAGSLTPVLYGIAMPLNFTYAGNGNKSFRQPFNQFGISPSYKWVTLHLGYRNLNYNPFTLSGHTIRGAGIDIKVKKLHGSFIYGRLNRATTIDTLSQSLVAATYTRKGYAAKIGYGDANNFIDLSLLKATDDSTTQKVDRLKYDAKNYPNLFAAQNIAAGVSTKVTIKNIFFESDLGFSIYTRDMQSPLALEDGGGSSILKAVNQLIYINGTSSYGKAVQAALGYKRKTFSIKLKYQYIDPNYKSMGTYFLATDIENITIAPSFIINKNKIRVNGSFGVQRDNLAGLKSSTSSRYIGNGNMGISFTKAFQMDVNFSNYSTNQKPNITNFADTLKITQATYNIGVMPRYIIMGSSKTSIFILSLQRTLLNDFNSMYAAGQQSRELKSVNSFLNYQLRFNRSGDGAGASLSYTNLKNDFAKQTNYGLTINGDKTFLSKKLAARASTSYLINKQNNSSGNIINASMDLSYTFLKKHSFGFSGYYTNNVPKVQTVLLPAYYQLRSEVYYNYKF